MALARSNEKPANEPLVSYPLIDWLRFVLASTVVLDHAGFRLWPFVNGGLAVSVFFALSGWLIGGILLRTNSSELPRFFFNRATRIWIPYAFAIVLLYGVAAMREGIGYYWLKYLILDVTFTHQLFTVFPAALAEMPLAGSGNQFWSIAVEEQFYLLAPILMIYVPRGRSFCFWVALMLLAAVLRLNALPISLGVIAAILQQKTSFADRPGYRYAAMGAALLAAVVLFGLAEGSVLSTLVAPFFAIAVVIACAGGGRRGALGVALGGLSYPLYLNHWIGVFVVHAMEKRWGQVGAPVFVTSQFVFNVVMAFVMYLLIDKTIQLKRNGWYTPRLGQNLAIMAYVLVGIGLVSGTLMHVFGPHAN